jgi:hypothetical protein
MKSEDVTKNHNFRIHFLNHENYKDRDKFVNDRNKFISYACYGKDKPSEICTQTGILNYYLNAKKIFNFENHTVEIIPSNEPRDNYASDESYIEAIKKRPMILLIDTAEDFLIKISEQIENSRKNKPETAHLLVDPVKDFLAKVEAVFEKNRKLTPDRQIFVIETRTNNFPPLISIQQIAGLCEQYNANLMGSISLEQLDPNTAIIFENIALELLNAKLEKPLNICRKPLQNPLETGLSNTLLLLSDRPHMHDEFGIPPEVTKYIAGAFAKASLQEKPPSERNSMVSNFCIKTREVESKKFFPIELGDEKDSVTSRINQSSGQLRG